jgi:hypothetical protein
MFLVVLVPAVNNYKSSSRRDLLLYMIEEIVLRVFKFLNKKCKLINREILKFARQFKIFSDLKQIK